MAVSLVVDIPATPANGFLRFIPLGGNGYTSPFAMWQCQQLLVTGDATGGAASITVNMDRRYCSMMGYASMTYPGTTPDPFPLRWAITGDRVPQQFRAVKVDLIPTTISAARVSDTWLPPATVNPGPEEIALSITVPNTDTLVLQMHCAIFLFNINARQKVPYHLLAAARGGI